MSTTPEPLSDSPTVRPAPSAWWPWVLCLLGVDYFSTLAYQPSLSFQLAGRLAPLATLLVVLLTLFGAVPVYWFIAGRSPHGQGSIALLERHLHGWRGKTLVLILLGFAATDFVMIKTISLADAAEHLAKNRYIKEERPQAYVATHEYVGGFKETVREYAGDSFADFFNEQLVLTILLSIVGFVFWWVLRNGFNKNVLVLAGAHCRRVLVAQRHRHRQRRRLSGPKSTAHRELGEPTPDRRLATARPAAFTGWGGIALLCLLLLPELSLGFSGFEMSLILMPQVQGFPDDDRTRPHGRIRNTRKLLVVAALIMCVYLLGAVLVTTVLIPPEALTTEGGAHNRALAYLAHGGPLAVGDGPAQLQPWFDRPFGTLYDVTTILMLSLAGTSVMTALATLLPQYLLRFGMELRLAHRWGVLLTLFALINLAVTLYFRASVNEQRAAYSTAVLVLLTDAAVISAVASRREKGKLNWMHHPWGFTVIACIFACTTVAVVIQSTSGLLIAALFVATILASSISARALRVDELRTLGFDFVDEQSKFIWNSLCCAEFPILVPHRPGRHERDCKEVSIRRDHQLAPNVEIVFLEVEVDDPSNFYQKLLVEVIEEETRFVIKVTAVCRWRTRWRRWRWRCRSRAGRPGFISAGRKWTCWRRVGATWRSAKAMCRGRWRTTAPGGAQPGTPAARGDWLRFFRFIVLRAPQAEPINPCTITITSFFPFFEETELCRCGNGRSVYAGCCCWACWRWRRRKPGPGQPQRKAHAQGYFLPGLRAVRRARCRNISSASLSVEIDGSIAAARTRVSPIGAVPGPRRFR